MDYEQKYKEALAKARDMMSYKEVRHEDMEYLFPELAESEDERTRKWLISQLNIKSNGTDSDLDIMIDKAIAWLEKQGKMDMESYKTAEDEKRKFVGDGFIKCYADFQDFKEGETYWLEYIGNDNYNVRSDNLLGKTYYITPCQLYTIFKKQNWLEKQGQQKPLYIRFGDIPANGKSKIYCGEKETGHEVGVSVYPAFRDTDGRIVLGLSLPITRTTLYTQQHLLEYDNRPCYLVSGDYVGRGSDGEPLISNVNIIEEIEEYRVKEVKSQGKTYTFEGKSVLEALKEVEVNNANCATPKIKPKFHKGDWIINPETGNVLQIKNVLLCGNIGNYEFDNGSMLIESVDKHYRQWTIQDAKDGDVICYETKNELRIFIYIGYGHTHYHCCYYNEHLTTVDSFFVIQKHLESYIHPATKEQRDLLFLKMKEAGYTWNPNEKKLKKIEPKFKVGDWIVNNEDGSIGQIRNIVYDESGYGYDHTNGWFHSAFEKDYHLWNITKDAKDGDILVCEDNIPFIFKNFDRFHPECPVAYCGIDDVNHFIVSMGDGWWTDEKCYPATKEQCNFLFKKMHEAGYQWDADKKELKKISQRMISAEAKEALYDKPTWSEEDEKMVKQLIKNQEILIDTTREEHLRSIYAKEIKWLESLRLQNRWKPNDEQMQVLLSEVTAWSKGCYKQKVLESLYNDLEKLKEK